MCSWLRRCLLQSHSLNLTDFTEFQKAVVALNATQGRYIAAGLDADGDDGLDHYSEESHVAHDESNSDAVLPGGPPGSGGDGPFLPPGSGPSDPNSSGSDPPGYSPDDAYTNATFPVLDFNLTGMEGYMSVEMFQMMKAALSDYSRGTSDIMYCSYQLEYTCGAGFST